MLQMSESSVKKIFEIQEKSSKLTKNLLNNKTVVIASHNSGKIMEFKSLFSGYNVNVITSSEINIEDVDEVGKTFKEKFNFKS